MTARLTDFQARQLVSLLGAGAVAEARAASIHQLAGQGFGNTLVLGALRDQGLADSKVVREAPAAITDPRERRQRLAQSTVYWLTDAGVERARQLQKAPNG